MHFICLFKIPTELVKLRNGIKIANFQHNPKIGALPNATDLMQFVQPEYTVYVEQEQDGC